MDRVRPIKQTKLQYIQSRSSISIHRKLFWTRASHANNNTKNYLNKFSNGHNFSIQSVAKKLLLLAASIITCTPAYATDVGGVSATANPIANSSGSVTNQAIQVLQGPYITNTYGGGIQCQGATMNITPYVTGTGSFRRPFEHTYMDPVYNNADNNDDNIPDNPGQILYEIPTRTGQTENYNLAVGMSATWSRPLDKKLQELCKSAATTQIGLQQQMTANKRLDFEIARLKNCGELMKAGIMFHPKSPYAAVCADVMLVQPPNVIVPHAHSLKTSSPQPSSEVSSSDQTSEAASPSSPDTDLPESQKQLDGKESDQASSGFFRWPFSRQASQPSKVSQQAALLGGPMSLPQPQFPPLSQQLEVQEDTEQ